jgi:hypothetical protein
MSFDEIYQLSLLVLPPLATIAFLLIAIRLFHERPIQFFLGFIRELLSIFDRKISVRALNLIGALIMLILILLAFAEGLLDTVFVTFQHSQLSPLMEAYKTSLRYGIISFFGIYFLISLAIARREP